MDFSKIVGKLVAISGDYDVASFTGSVTRCRMLESFENLGKTPNLLSNIRFSF